MVKSSEFWKWAERFLLVCVLILQVAILVNGKGSGPAVVNSEGESLTGSEPRPSPFLDVVNRGSPRPSSIGDTPRAVTYVDPGRFMPPPLAVNAGGGSIGREQVFSRMGVLFEQAVRDLDRLRYLDRGWDALISSPSMDMRDRGDNYLVTFCVPGVDASQVDVLLKGRLLTVDVPVGSAQGGRFQMFRRRVQLPGSVGPCESASAVLTNGVLRIMVPKCVAPAGSSMSAVAHRLM